VIDIAAENECRQSARETKMVIKYVANDDFAGGFEHCIATVVAPYFPLWPLNVAWPRIDHGRCDEPLSSQP
jgi:hypothetical protein